MALRLITCSPRRTALLPPSRPEKLLPPGALTPAPRRQDHTPSPYASAALVCRSLRVHRDPPHDRDDHDAPLLSGRDGDRYASVRTSDKAKYFLFRGLTRFPTIGSDLPVGLLCRRRDAHFSLRVKLTQLCGVGSRSAGSPISHGAAGSEPTLRGLT